MPRPIEICLEDLNLSPEDERYMRCVALPGDEKGLGLDDEGKVRWMDPGPVACQLWVSADDQLILLRSEGSAPVTIQRAGRSVDPPADKPVVLLDQDLLRQGEHRLRVHVHGATEEVFAPEPLTGSSLRQLARAAAAALALSASVGAGAATAHPGGDRLSGVAGQPIEVRARPPKPARPKITCQISKLVKRKKGPSLLHATCPAGHRVKPGTTGIVIDAKTGFQMKDGRVKVKTVDGQKVVAETALRDLKKAKEVFLYSY